ncbi:MAG: P-loop ATPase, Sll1717 family [Isosphaeraceae bacterium]
MESYEPERPSHTASLCQYADGPCDQEFSIQEKGVFFIYPSTPPQIAATIEAAVTRLRELSGPTGWSSWRNLPIAGQIVFCEICKAMRNASAVVADVTTLNFNVLFEIGFAIGLNLPVIPIRDTTYELDRKNFEELGVLDTLGYLDFSNTSELIEQVTSRLPVTSLPEATGKEFRETPVYVVKDAINTEGTIQLMSTMAKSGLKYRTYDPEETPSLTLGDARRQVAGSFGVVAHMLSPNRRGSTSHNALCAVIGGLAMAQKKTVVLLQEERIQHPIDYRDVALNYSLPAQIAGLLVRPIQHIVEQLQVGAAVTTRRPPRRLLERVDLGDVAAENEIRGLQSYFVPTGQSRQARQGHARLVVGRKGTGKTALFFDIQNSLPRSNSVLTLAMKPEGHQFIKLRDLVRDRLPAGLSEHTMVAFWTYILLCEFAREIIDVDRVFARRDPTRSSQYDRVSDIYRGHDPGSDADFAQRLQAQINRVTENFNGLDLEQIGARLTEIIYSGDIRELSEAVGEYLTDKETVWLLVDNIDKGWPLRGSTDADILIVRALLEATRKLQQQLAGADVDFKCLVFLRTDIYEHLSRDMPDKGKDTAIRLDWEDEAVFKEIIRRRVETSTTLRGGFDEIWRSLCESHVGAQDSFGYVVERTLMRPRDLLLFLHRAIEVALNRGHTKIMADDLQQAEKSYSEEMLLTTAYEIEDTKPDYWEVPYAFEGLSHTLQRDEVELALEGAGVDEGEEIERVVELLVWYGFLGVHATRFPDAKFSYDVQYNIRRLMQPIEFGDGAFVIHPAFRPALDSQ